MLIAFCIRQISTVHLASGCIWPPSLTRVFRSLSLIGRLLGLEPRPPQRDLGVPAACSSLIGVSPYHVTEPLTVIGQFHIDTVLALCPAALAETSHAVDGPPETHVRYTVTLCPISPDDHALHSLVVAPTRRDQLPGMGHEQLHTRTNPLTVNH